MATATETRSPEIIDEVVAWVEVHAVWLALALLILGTAVRVMDAASCYLNPDEGAHFRLANVTSWALAWRASLTIMHPPLFILVLHALLPIGRSELLLRLPSLTAGIGALWLIFAWIQRTLGPVPALVATWFMAVSPAAISASTEVRQYGLLIFLVCASLLAAETAFQEGSVFQAMLHGILVLGALLTTYTALVPAAATGLYVLVRLTLTRVSPRVRIAFIGAQASWVILVTALYLVQLRGLIAVAAGREPAYLQGYYRAGCCESVAAYLLHALRNTFTYLSGFRGASLLLIVGHAAGITALLTRGSRDQQTWAVLLFAPFVIATGATLAHIFPMGSSRHIVYLLPFVAAGLAASMAWLQRRTAVLFLVTAVLLTPLFLQRTRPDNDPRSFPEWDMEMAISTIRRTVPAGSTLFVDYETREILGYYLQRNHMDTLVTRREEEATLGGYHVAVPDQYLWAFSPETAVNDLDEWAAAHQLPTGTQVWIVSSSWLNAPLASKIPASADLDPHLFGRISVIRVITGNPDHKAARGSPGRAAGKAADEARFAPRRRLGAAPAALLTTSAEDRERQQGATCEPGPVNTIGMDGVASENSARRGGVRRLEQFSSPSFRASIAECRPSSRKGGTSPGSRGQFVRRIALCDPLPDENEVWPNLRRVNRR